MAANGHRVYHLEGGDALEVVHHLALPPNRNLSSDNRELAIPQRLN